MAAAGFFVTENLISYEIKTFRSKKGNKKSTRRDSNPRPSPWQGDTPPLSHSCIKLICCYLLSVIYYITNILIVKNNFNYLKSFSQENFI